MNGAVAARCSRRRRPATESSRRRSRWGSQRRAGCSVGAGLHPGGQVGGERDERTRSGSARSRATAGWPARRPSRSGCGPPRGPGGGGAARGRSAGRRMLVTNAVLGMPRRSVMCSSAGVGAFLAHDQPHTRRPTGEVEDVGELGDERPGARSAVGVVGRLPRRAQDLGSNSAGSTAGRRADRSSRSRTAGGGSARPPARACHRRRRCG